MRLKPEQRVSIDSAKEAALAALNSAAYPVPASWIATFIWPDHQMKAQGAGAAASRILKRLESEGRCRWASIGHTWGWIACSQLTHK